MGVQVSKEVEPSSVDVTVWVAMKEVGTKLNFSTKCDLYHLSNTRLP